MELDSWPHNEATDAGFERVKLDDGGVWLHAAQPEALGDVDALSSAPEDVVEELRSPPARAHRTDHEGWTVWTLRTVWFADASASVDVEELVVTMGHDVVITVGKLPATTERRMFEEQQGPEPSAPGDAAKLVAMVVNGLLDDVGEVMGKLDDEVEEVEKAVFAPGRDSHAERIYRLKREVHTVRRCVGPLPELFTPQTTASDGSDATENADVPSDVVTRARRLAEALTQVDELLESVLAAHLARVAIRQNDDMRRISAWAAIVAGPTAIAGIYGMNFQFMPELDWQFGYPLVVATMFVICGGLFWAFHRRGWL